MEGDGGSRQHLARDQGAVDGHAGRDVAEQATGPGGLRQRPEVGVWAGPVGLAEEARDQLGVLADRGRAGRSG